MCLLIIHIFFRQNVSIQHAGNGREREFAGKWKVDGYVAEEGRIIEFLGCYYHGCPICNRYYHVYNNYTIIFFFSPDSLGPNNKTARENYLQTMERLEKLEPYCENLEFFWVNFKN